MNDKQRVLIENLLNVLCNLENECNKDDDFNSKLAELDVFQRDIGEIISDILLEIRP